MEVSLYSKEPVGSAIFGNLWCTYNFRLSRIRTFISVNTRAIAKAENTGARLQLYKRRKQLLNQLAVEEMEYRQYVTYYSSRSALLKLGATVPLLAQYFLALE
jgi:hypothetical protein